MSATSGFTLGQRVEHVGGNLKAGDGHCVQFGSIMAVAWFCDHLTRDLINDCPAVQNGMLIRRIEQVEKRHGSLRAAARELGIDASYLFRLKNAEKMNPSEEVLDALGLERVTFYRNKKEEG